MMTQAQVAAERIRNLTGSDKPEDQISGTIELDSSEFVKVGKNVELSIGEDNVMLIRIDLKQRFGVSPSGKSTSVASSGGNIEVGVAGIKLGLNAFVPIPKHLQEPKVEVHNL